MEGSGHPPSERRPEDLPDEIGIFELPLVLLPGEITPLHIFEQRYRALINECVADDRLFGFLYRDEDGTPAPVGCAAVVSDVLERLDDGRINIVVTGAIPFRIVSRHETAAYPAAMVEWIDPGAEPEGDAEDEALTATLGEAAREAMRTLLETIGQSENEPADLDQLDAFGMASKIELPSEPKQEMLLAGAEADRLRLLTAALVDLEMSLVKAQEIAEIASSNGHGKLNGKGPG